MKPTDTPILPQPALAAPEHETSNPLFEITEDDLAILQAAIPEKAKELGQDSLAFWRELPRLLADGEEGRYALLHGGSIVSLWDSLSDATQAGYDKYGTNGRFMTASIKHLELERIRQYCCTHRLAATT